MRTAITLLAAGVMVAGCSKMMGADDAEQIELTAVPAAARAALEREAGGAPLEEIEREVENGREVFEAEFTRDGKQWEVSVAADGTVLGKEEEGAEDDDDDDGDDDA